jgi:hypothetical protein
MNGINTQNRKIIKPEKITKICKIIPSTIKIILANAPNSLEITLETRVLKNSTT